MGACNQDPVPRFGPGSSASAEIDRLAVAMIKTMAAAVSSFGIHLTPSGSNLGLQGDVRRIIAEAFELGDACRRAELARVSAERDEIAKDRTRILADLVAARADRDSWKFRSTRTGLPWAAVWRRWEILATLGKLLFGEPVRVRATRGIGGSLAVAVVPDSAANDCVALVWTGESTDVFDRMRDALVARLRERESEKEMSAREVFAAVEQACSAWEGGP